MYYKCIINSIDEDEEKEESDSDEDEEVHSGEWK